MSLINLLSLVSWNLCHLKVKIHFSCLNHWIFKLFSVKSDDVQEENYKQFEESLKNDDDDTKENNVPAATKTNQNKNNNELRVGIKDWWVEFLHILQTRIPLNYVWFEIVMFLLSLNN